jgi:hypothetical protein
MDSAEDKKTSNQDIEEEVSEIQSEEEEQAFNKEDL